MYLKKKNLNYVPDFYANAPTLNYLEIAHNDANIPNKTNTKVMAERAWLVDLTKDFGVLLNAKRHSEWHGG